MRPARCPTPTPEPLWTEPVTSPTHHLTQTIAVFLGNGEAVTITCESGTFRQEGPYHAYSAPARIVIDLLPETGHHLEVAVRITSDYNGCTNGGYTLNATRDRYGNPLLIEQHALVPTVWLPLVLNAQP